jgi:hypothetical protein
MYIDPRELLGRISSNDLRVPWDGWMGKINDFIAEMGLVLSSDPSLIPINHYHIAQHCLQLLEEEPPAHLVKWDEMYVRSFQVDLRALIRTVKNRAPYLDDDPASNPNNRARWETETDGVLSSKIQPQYQLDNWAMSAVPFLLINPLNIS